MSSMISSLMTVIHGFGYPLEQSLKAEYLN
mgnify:CR=1 FL=1